MLLRLPISSPLCHVCQRCHGVNGFYEIRGVATVEIIREIQEDLYIYFINKPIRAFDPELEPDFSAGLKHSSEDSELAELARNLKSYFTKQDLPDLQQKLKTYFHST